MEIIACEFRLCIRLHRHQIHIASGIFELEIFPGSCDCGGHSRHLRHHLAAGSQTHRAYDGLYVQRHKPYFRLALFGIDIQ